MDAIGDEEREAASGTWVYKRPRKVVMSLFAWQLEGVKMADAEDKTLLERVLDIAKNSKFLVSVTLVFLITTWAGDFADSIRKINDFLFSRDNAVLDFVVVGSVFPTVRVRNSGPKPGTITAASMHYRSEAENYTERVAVAAFKTPPGLRSIRDKYTVDAGEAQEIWFGATKYRNKLKALSSQPTECWMTFEWLDFSGSLHKPRLDLDCKTVGTMLISETMKASVKIKVPMKGFVTPTAVPP